MKKFLLLLVGVLFALSAKADWTFYVDISNTNWGESTPYIYCGNGATESNYGDGKYFSKYAGTKVEGNIWKFEISGWSDLTSIIFSSNADYDVNVEGGKAQSTFTLDGKESYGAFTTFQKADRNWLAYNNALYILAPTGTDAATFDTRYITLEETTIVLKGGFDSWGDGISLTKQADLTYFANSGKQITADNELKFVIGGSWTGYNGTVTPDTPFFLDNSGKNFKLASKVNNTQITYDPILGGRINIYEGPRLFALRGDFRGIGGGNNWTNNNYTFTYVSEGVYTFDLAAAGVTTLKTKVDFKIYDISNGKWYRPSGNVDAGTEYELSIADGNFQVNADIANPVLKLVDDGTTLKLTIYDKGSTDPDPTPTVETAYTIYFDAVRSGSAWANPHLTLGGVEVIGVADGSLIKYAFNAAAGDEITFSNGSTIYTPALENNIVYFVESNAIASASKTGYSYSPTHDYTYDLWGQISGKDWGTSTPMTYYPDGTWRTAAITFEPYGDNNDNNNFGIRKLKDGKQYAVDNNDEHGWIWCETADNTMKVGVKSSAKIQAEGGTVNWKIDTKIFDGTTAYVLVFDPAKMTIMFINPAVAATATATVDPVSTTSHANKLSVTINISDYSSVVGGYALSNGTFTAVSTDGTFANVPYASNYTLTVGSTSMPINITMPAEPIFNIKAVNATTFAPAAGQTNGILSVAFTVETTWAYNLPHVICTCNGAVVPGNVEWSEGGFTFSAAEAVPITTTETGYTVTDNMTLDFVITPEYPFMVNSASTRGQMRVAGTGYQTVLGTAVSVPATLAGGKEVSGIEGVVIEAEDAPVEYFNLQGQRVDGELAPGIYIRRQGATVTKVRI